MQELRDFEKGIVTRAEEILVSGETPTSLRRRSSNARLVSSRSDLLKNSPVAGAAGPVARPVLRIQGSRNLLNSTSDTDEEDEAEQMEMQSNPMARPELKTNLSYEDDSPSSKSQRHPRSSPARGFGRGFPRKPSTRTPSIPEEQEESSRSLNYSETSEFNPGESFEESLKVCWNEDIDNLVFRRNNHANCPHLPHHHHRQNQEPHLIKIFPRHL